MPSAAQAYPAGTIPPAPDSPAGNDPAPSLSLPEQARRLEAQSAHADGAAWGRDMARAAALRQQVRLRWLQAARAPEAAALPGDEPPLAAAA